MKKSKIEKFEDGYHIYDNGWYFIKDLEQHTCSKCGEIKFWFCGEICKTCSEEVEE